MLPFEAQITEDMKVAMKAKDQIRLDCLRAIKSALKYKFVEKEQKDLTEDEGFQVLQTLIKQRKESAESFKSGGREDLATKELREAEIIEAFLPKALSEQELRALIQEAIQTTQSQSVKDLGKVMKELKPKIAGRADNKLVTDLIQLRYPQHSITQTGEIFGLALFCQQLRILILLKCFDNIIKVALHYR